MTDYKELANLLFPNIDKTPHRLFCFTETAEALNVLEVKLNIFLKNIV